MSLQAEDKSVSLILCMLQSKYLTVFLSLGRYVIAVTDIGCVPVNDLYFDPTVGGVSTK